LNSEPAVAHRSHAVDSHVGIRSSDALSSSFGGEQQPHTQIIQSESATSDSVMKLSNKFSTETFNSEASYKSVANLPYEFSTETFNSGISYRSAVVNQPPAVATSFQDSVTSPSADTCHSFGACEAPPAATAPSERLSVEESRRLVKNELEKLKQWYRSTK